MHKELALKITFSKKLSETEQTTLWDTLIAHFEKHNLRTAGGSDEFGLDWSIDYSGSTQSKADIIDGINELLMQAKTLISHFQIQ